MRAATRWVAQVISNAKQILPILLWHSTQKADQTAIVSFGIGCRVGLVVRPPACSQSFVIFIGSRVGAPLSGAAL